MCPLQQFIITNSNLNVKNVTSITVHINGNYISHAAPELIRKCNALLRKCETSFTIKALFDIPFTGLSRFLQNAEAWQCRRWLWRASGSRFGPTLTLWLMVLMRHFVEINKAIHSCYDAQSVLQLLRLTSS